MGKGADDESAKKKGFSACKLMPPMQRGCGNLDHLLLHCPSVWGYWVTLFPFPRMDWTCPFWVKDLMVG